MKKLILLLLLTGCAPKKVEPQLDPVKVQRAIFELGQHVMAIEKKLGITYEEKK